jgi:acetyltransferase
VYRHYLSPLLAPRSVALVGASEREGSLGRLVLENLEAARAKLAVFAVNPKHRQVLGHACVAHLRDLPAPPELAVIVTPAAIVPRVLEEAGEAGVQAAIVLSAGFAEAGPAGKALLAEAMGVVRKHKLRVLGPNCLGLLRPSLGLNATFARNGALEGRLALISQSGAICTAIMDWANGAGIGFSSIVSLGAAADVDFGELLDFLAADEATEAILLYIEGIRDARRFMSALRAAARTKPVIALKVGRYAAGTKAVATHTAALMGRDEVFDSALARAGAVRVKTYTQLFAAARVLASSRPRTGERLAVVTNGGGPGVMAADSAAESGVPLAVLGPETIAALDAVLPAQWPHANPVDILGDAPAARFAAALDIVLRDSGVDTALVLYCPVAVTAPAEAAAAVADTVRAQAKPVLAAWLGELRTNKARDILEAAGVADFYTPENAVQALSFLAEYRRNQAQLLEVPAALAVAGAERPRADIEAALGIRGKALKEGRTQLTEDETKALLEAFGIPVPAAVLAKSADEAVAAASQLGFPAVLKIRSRDISHKSDVGGVRLALPDAQAVAAAYDDILARARELRPDAAVDGVVVQAMLRFEASRELLVGLSRDPVFGPVITFGAGGIAVEVLRDTAVALPPLNALLAHGLVARTRVSRVLGAYRSVPAVHMEALVSVILGVARMASLLPWLVEMDLNPVLAHPGGATVADARASIDPHAPERPQRYAHMAIHPYPEELEEPLSLKDGTRLALRPMRPEDALREQRFVTGLSERSRFLRFQHYSHDLSPELLERFTQLDYDRELALVVLGPDGEFLAVGRYAPTADGETAEFALAVADAWQGRGIGGALLSRLRDAAREAGYKALVGYVLADNSEMLNLAAHMGFVQQSRDGDTAVVIRKL